MGSFSLRNSALLIISFFLLGGLSVVEAAVAPTNFTAIATSSCAILLEWEDTNPNGTTYDIKRGVVVAPSGIIGVTKGAGDLYFIDKHDSSPWGGAIDPDDSHEYSVRAKNNITPTQTVWVGPESATTFSLPSQPGQPINTTSTVDDDTGNIEISWTTSTVGSEYFDAYGGSEIWLATSDNGGITYTDFSQIGRVPGDPARILNGKFFYESLSNDKDLSYQYKLRIQEVGGFGCDFTRPQHVALSADSSVLTIPRRPGNLDAQFVSEQSKIILTWNDNQSIPNETEFEIHRSTDSGFSSYQQLSADPDLEEYEDMDIVQTPPTTYYYRIRSCINDTCSFWSPGLDENEVKATTGLPVSADLNLRISYATVIDATTTLAWTPEADIILNSELRIERATSSLEFQEIRQLGHNDPRRVTGVYLDEQLLLGETYTYRIRVCDGDGDGATCSEYSTSQPSVNLNLLFILKGVAWAATASTTSAISTGVGWIKFNSAAEGGQVVDSSISYSVQIDKAGLVTGMAWADVITGDRASYGWLSFDPEDLVGCPSTPCEAIMVSTSTGAMSGWARFLAPKSFAAGDSNWDGWVSLSGTTQAASLDSPFSALASLFNVPEFIKKPFSVFASLFDFATAHAQTAYGVQVDLTSCIGKECPLQGQAWGSELVGWIGFGSDTCGTDGGGNPKCTVRVEVINEPPSVSNVQIVAGGDWCVEVPSYSVAWQFSDLDGDAQVAAEVKFAEFVDDSWVVGTSTIITTDQTHRFWDPLGYEATGSYDQAGYLSTSTNYTVWVKVFDGLDWSPWVTGDATTTPSHYGPWVDSIVWDVGDTPPQGVGFKATTTALSVDRTSNGQGLSNFSWNFTKASPSPQTTTVSSTSVFVFGSPVTSIVTVTDNLGVLCTIPLQTDDFGLDDTELKRRIFRER